MATKEEQRKRLVDHFKRAYQIIVGLSITLACIKLFPNNFPTFPFDTSFWLFCVFFITVVPIFHGGDRSLDIKYLDKKPKDLQRIAYIWDVYMLFITAILFVKIAQAIPVPQSASSNPILGGVPPPTTAEPFYRWMTTMLIIDVGILLVDWAKTARLDNDSLHNLGAYWPWAGLNISLAVVCSIAVWLDYPLSSTAAVWTSIVVFIFALLRTSFDYYLGREFMFP